MKKTRRLFAIPAASVCLKVVLLMKAAFFLILATCMQVSAHVYSQQKFTFNFKQTEVSSILTKIQKQSDYRFFYNYAALKKLGKVSVEIKDGSIEQVLELVLNDQLPYKMSDDHVVIISTPELAGSQVAVKGKVVDADGTTLVGVTVKLQGTNIGATTDVNGNFSIEAPVNGVLEFSYIGFEKQLITVTGAQTLTVTMKTLPSSLNEVVVIGYGTSKKVDITGSVASVKGTDLQNLPITTAAQALEGRASGVNIVRNDGSPGAAPSIRIRGTGTLNDANPLIIIDGVPTNNADALSDVNPNDIASVDILKDASSGAIYGTRAANGVVLVTTRKGTYSQKLSTNVNFYTGFSNTTKYIDLLTAPDLYTLKRERYTNDGVDIDALWNDSYYATQRTDWQRAIMGTGKVVSGDVNIQGGNEVSNYYFSTSIYNEKGIIDKTDFKRYGVRINSEHKVKSWFKLGENVQLTFSDNNGFDNNDSQTGLIFSALRFNPAIPLVNPDGTYGTSKASPQLGDINSPYATVQQTDKFNRKYRVLANAFAEATILPELKFRVNYAFDGTIGRTYNFNILDVNQTRENRSSTLVQTESEVYSQLVEGFLTFDKQFSKSHVTLTGGVSYQNLKGSDFEAGRVGFNDTDFNQRVLKNGSSLYSATGNYNLPSALVSGFARGFYDYDGRFLATVTFRADGSSRFAEGNRWGYFPAFSLGWRLSNEPFMRNLGWISNLKLTGGWGELGNQSILPFQYLSTIAINNTYGNGGYAFGGTGVSGSAVTSIANPDIHWERTQMTNISLEAGFLNNRLNTTITYFNKNTKDMLIQPPLVGAYGLARIPDQNIGRMNNKGIEIDVNYQGGNKVQYTVGANASFIKNTVTKLNGPGTFVGSAVYGRSSQEIARTYQGEPLASFYGWKTGGLYQTQADIDGDPALTNDLRKANIRPGDVRFLDLNGDGLIDGNDRTILGNPNPKATAGVQGSLKYKNFDLAANFTGVFGVSIYNADRMQGIDPTYPFNLYAETINRWTGPGTSNTIPRMALDPTNNNYRTSDLFVESGSYFSLKNLTIGYTFPAWTKKAALSSVRLYASGQNVFMITGYKGYTPELGYTDGNKQRGVDVAQYPAVRTITFGATIKL